MVPHAMTLRSKTPGTCASILRGRLLAIAVPKYTSSNTEGNVTAPTGSKRWPPSHPSWSRYLRLFR